MAIAPLALLLGGLVPSAAGATAAPVRDPAVGPNARPGLEIIRFIEKADDRGLAMVRERAPFVPMPSTPQAIR